MVLFGYNILMTWRRRPATYDVPVIQAPRLAPEYVPTPGHGAPVPASSSGWARFVAMDWHRAWERLPVTFSVLTAVAVVVASLFEILPTFLIRSNVPTIASVKPYTPLELAGRDVYIAEGCFNCHSQMIRPFRHETERYGEYSKPGEFVYDHPFLWGSRRIGPDLAREGGKYPNLWHGGVGRQHTAHGVRRANARATGAAGAPDDAHVAARSVSKRVADGARGRDGSPHDAAAVRVALRFRRDGRRNGARPRRHGRLAI